MRENPELNLAANFVEKTDRTIFLTGKAGTGKTTFLHNIKAQSLKRLVIVAPTGVAAINAKGVTIHSFFQMPFGPILPDGNQQANIQRKFNRSKIDIIKSLDLLIIDEISMVRADLLDGIDQVLRRYKNRSKVFGGVQVLMIGDLQQLSPVVKDNEWELLKSYYKTPYFFSSKAFQECKPINIELKHIYRQDNEMFIKILNEIRNNKLTETSSKSLNKRYLPNFIPDKKEGYITLTTHNNRANQMNDLELKKLNSKSFLYTAEVNGKFPEHAFPTQQSLALKKGAQVMFIKNDSTQDKRYFNGKIGEIIQLSKEEITVRCPGDDFDIVTTAEIWENVNYSIHKETKEISEDIVGSFSQIPLRLAWAITIHKSQGLTFEKAIIDAEASFAHGQTYVALSRCRTLEGIVLKNKISERSIINDIRVTSFNENVANNLPDEKALHESQKVYQLNLISDLFNFYDFLYPINRLIDIFYKNESSLKGNIIEVLMGIKDEGITKLLQVTSSFNHQLKELSLDTFDPEKDTVIKERIVKAIIYFIEQAKEKVSNPFDELTFITENKEVEKDIKKQLKILRELVVIKSFCLNGLSDGFTVRKYLEVRAKAVLQKSTVTIIKTEYAAKTEHTVLFSELRALRSSFAEAEDIERYQVFTQKSLFGMCELLPTTLEQLQAINGMGKVRVQKYGSEIIEVIKNYCLAFNIQQPKELALNVKVKKEKTHVVSFQLFKEGLSISEVANKRGLVVSTIESHLFKYVLLGDLKITDLIPELRYLELKKAINKIEFKGITDLKSKVDPKFTYSELQMMSQFLMQKNT
jgi:ribonuclease D